MVLTKHWCQRQLKIDSHLWPICLIYNTYFHFILPSTDRDRVKLMVAGGGKIILQLLFNVIFKRGQGQQCKRQGEGWTWEQHLKKSALQTKQKFKWHLIIYLIKKEMHLHCQCWYVSAVLIVMQFSARNLVSPHFSVTPLFNMSLILKRLARIFTHPLSLAWVH